MRPVIAHALSAIVEDVLPTVAELRRASEALLKARRLPAATVQAMTASRDAEAWVRELTDRVRSRASSAGIADNELLALAYDVIDGRRTLWPADPLEEAA
jgi:hypothetical protein